jgi:hypothetical protein
MIPLGRQPAEGYSSGFTRKSPQTSKFLRKPPGFMRFLPLRIRRLQVQVLPDAPLKIVNVFNVFVSIYLAHCRKKIILFIIYLPVQPCFRSKT